MWDGEAWIARTLDNHFFLGTGTWDGSNTYNCAEPDPNFPFWVTDVAGMGGFSPDLNLPPIGCLAYFRADSANTGPAYLRIHIDLPNVSGFSGQEIVRPDGSSLAAGDIPAGAMVAIVWDAITNGLTPPASGVLKWRMLAVLTGGGTLATGGTGSDLSATGPGLVAQASTGAALTVSLPSAGLLLTGGVLSLDIPGLTAEATPAAADLVAIYDASAAAHCKSTLAQVNAVLDHGTLAGLADDDHPLYPLGRGAGAAGRLALWADADSLTSVASSNLSASGLMLGSSSAAARTLDVAATANQQRWTYSTNPAIYGEVSLPSTGVLTFASTGNTVALATGVVTIGTGSSFAIADLDGGAGSTRGLRFRTGGLNRWQIMANTATESGSNAGSDFGIFAYDDAGAALFGTVPVFSINRATGSVGIGSSAIVSARLQVTAAPTDSTLTRYGISVTFSPSYSSGSPNINNGINVLSTLSGSNGASQINGAVFDARAAHSAGTVSTAYGVEALARSQSAGAVTSLVALRGDIISSGGATITNSMGCWVPGLSLTGGGTIATTYGVRVDNQGATGVTTSYGLRIISQSGATTSWAIGSDGGPSYHVGSLMLGGSAGTTPAAKLEVQQTSLGTAAVKRSSTATNDDPSLTEQHGRVTTTNNTTTTLTGCTQTLTADKAYRIKAKVVARRTGGSAGAANDVGAWEFEGIFINTGGTAAQQGATAPLFGDGLLVTAGMTAVFDCNAADVRVRVTGATNYNVVWHGILEYSEVGT